MIWLYVPAEDFTVDDEHQLRRDDYTDTRISVQHCLVGGGYAVNEYEGEDDDLACTMIAVGLSSLAAAKRRAEVHWRNKQK